MLDFNLFWQILCCSVWILSNNIMYQLRYALRNCEHWQIILTSITLHLSLRRSYMRIKASDPPMARYSGKTGFIERHLASRTRTDSAWRFTRMLGSLGGARMSVSLKKEDEIPGNRKIFFKFYQPNFISISASLIILISKLRYVLFSYSDIYPASLRPGSMWTVINALKAKLKKLKGSITELARLNYFQTKYCLLQILKIRYDYLVENKLTSQYHLLKQTRLCWDSQALLPIFWLCRYVFWKFVWSFQFPYHEVEFYDRQLHWPPYCFHFEA